MSATSEVDQAAPGIPITPTPRRIAVVRAVLALVWAAALALVIGDKVPTTGTDIPVGIALLLASYPLIDVVASLLTSAFGDSRVLRLNAAVSGLAVVAIAVAGIGSDAGATLVAFGAWAVASGLMLLVIAVHRRRSRGGQLPLIASGAISTVAGIGFIAASGSDDAHLGNLAGYMAFGAVLFLLSAYRRQAA
jgi:hypothetical protein